MLRLRLCCLVLRGSGNALRLRLRSISLVEVRLAASLVAVCPLVRIFSLGRLATNGRRALVSLSFVSWWVEIPFSTSVSQGSSLRSLLSEWTSLLASLSSDRSLGLIPSSLVSRAPCPFGEVFGISVGSELFGVSSPYVFPFEAGELLGLAPFNPRYFSPSLFAICLLFLSLNAMLLVTSAGLFNTQRAYRL